MRNETEITELAFEGLDLDTLAILPDEAEELNSGDSIIEALDRIQNAVKDSALCPEFWQATESDRKILSAKLGFNDNQLIIIAILAEIGDPVSWRALGEFIGISRLKAMAFTPDMNALRRARWVFSTAARERRVAYVGFKLAYGVITALRNNTVFVPESIENLPEQVFIQRITAYIYNEGHDFDIPYEEKKDWLFDMINASPELPLSKEISKIPLDFDRIALIMLIADYVRCNGDETSGLRINDFEQFMTDDFGFDIFANDMRNGESILFESNLTQHDFSEGMVDTERFILTPEAISRLIPDFKLRKSRCHNSTIHGADCIKPTSINPKELFYNPAEEKAISNLCGLFEPEALAGVQSRLTEKGMRTGITCLFYGSPGTGKTETALQLARLSGRNIMQVDISAMRDKFVGESEKNIKAVFRQYKKLCESSESTPILLFNEADAVIGRRLESVNSSVEKMDNSMQNIILQELEDFKGILIATTNLTGNLDKAFDRRFLFKIEFKRPSNEAKTSIWRSMLPEIDQPTASILAEEFDFSGGQIENIVRKVHINYALSGELPTLCSLQKFCAEEALNRSSRAPIGF